jgi:23S rRNA (cytosine1962-C5)-methyltransferase
MEIKGIVVLKRGKEQSLERFHPWVFSGAIEKLEGQVEDGCWVEVRNFNGKTLGFGHYQNGSIAVRVLSFGTVAPTRTFWTDRISDAIQLRKSAGLPSAQTNAFRLAHGEGDGVPGLIIDYYDGVAIVQAHSAGMHQDRHLITEALLKNCKSVYYKSQSTLPGKTRGPLVNEYLHGSAGVPYAILEYDVTFLVDWENGQKTGFFLDQRENRNLLKQFSAGKIVLNTFCYTGGFSVYALKGGATRVDSVDSSEKAIALTRRNLAANGFDSDANGCYAVDTFDFLEGKEDVYDVIVLDPPAFAKHREARHQAVKGYQRLNAEALKVIRKGGILFTFSCSQVVDRTLFYNTIVSAAIQSGRQIKVLQHLSQPADHPVSIFHREGEYLKGLVLYVE